MGRVMWVRENVMGDGLKGQFSKTGAGKSKAEMPAQCDGLPLTARRRARVSSRPPRAKTCKPKRRASAAWAAKRNAPRGRASGCVAVAKTGDSKIAPMPARCARMMAVRECAAADMGWPRRRRNGRATAASGRCRPQRSRHARRSSPPMRNGRPRWRQKAAQAGAICICSGVPPPRKITPVLCGNRSIAARQSSGKGGVRMARRRGQLVASGIKVIAWRQMRISARCKLL